jgi:hypothetical protein
MSALLERNEQRRTPTIYTSFQQTTEEQQQVLKVSGRSWV